MEGSAAVRSGPRRTLSCGLRNFASDWLPSQLCGPRPGCIVYPRGHESDKLVALRTTCRIIRVHCVIDRGPQGDERG